MKKIRDVTKLPQPQALKELDRSQRTINDYGKLTPIRDEEPGPVVLQLLRKK